MAVNVSGFRRNLKNIAHNYSDAQVKVREATSNDPWGPSSTLMSEVSEMTYNVVAFSEIMQMVWKRLNDHGKNWRHVYKALVLLEYLIKNGNEKVSVQCKENIYAIQTLKDFQYFEDNKDQGMNVREKAKQLVTLLKDDEKLRSERKRAVIAHSRIKGVIPSTGGYGSDSSDLGSPLSPDYPSSNMSGSLGGRTSPNRELEGARPQTAGEEELQLALALAMSREEADKEDEKRKSDDVRLQLAISESQSMTHKPGGGRVEGASGGSALVDLLDINIGSSSQSSADPWGMPNTQQETPDADPWGFQPPKPQPQPADPWQPTSPSPEPVIPPLPSGDPWVPVQQQPSPSSNNDPWSAPGSQQQSVDPWGVPSQENRSNGNVMSNSGSLDDFAELSLRDKSNVSGSRTMENLQTSGNLDKKTPKSFLGENSNLVNLDNLVSAKPTHPVTATSMQSAPLQASSEMETGVNPFANQPNPFQTQAPRPSMNEMRGGSPAGQGGGTAPSPWTVQQQQQQDPTYNPFLS